MMNSHCPPHHDVNRLVEETPSHMNRAYQAAIVLNNTAISLLRQCKYKDSIETFRDGLKVMRYSYVTSNSSSIGSSHNHQSSSSTTGNSNRIVKNNKIVGTNRTTNNVGSSTTSPNNNNDCRNENDTVAVEDNDEDTTTVHCIISNTLRVASERLARPLATTTAKNNDDYFGTSTSLDVVETLFFDHTPESLIRPAMDTDVLGLCTILQGGTTEEEQEQDEDMDEDDLLLSNKNTMEDDVGVNDDDNDCDNSKILFYLIRIDDIDDDDLVDFSSTTCTHNSHNNGGEHSSVYDDCYHHIKSRTLDTSILLNNYGVAFAIYYEDYCRRHPNHHEVVVGAASRQEQVPSSVSPNANAIGELLLHSEQFFQLAYNTLDDELRTYEDDDDECDDDMKQVGSSFASCLGNPFTDCGGLQRTTMLLTSLVLQNLMHISFRLDEHNYTFGSMMSSNRSYCSTTNGSTTSTTTTTALSTSSQHSMVSSATNTTGLEERNHRADTIFGYYCEISRIQKEYVDLEQLVQQHRTAAAFRTSSRTSDIARAA